MAWAKKGSRFMGGEGFLCSAVPVAPRVVSRFGGSLSLPQPERQRMVA